MQTNYTNHLLSQTLTCTANDVSVARATNIDITSGGECHDEGTPPVQVCTCNQGGNVTFTADYEVLLTAQARYDVGIYFATDGDPNGNGALTGACKLTTLDGANSDNFINLDAVPGKNFQAGDVCGDIDAAHNPQNLHLTLTVACQPGADGKLKLPNCTSWRQPGSNEICDEAIDAFPGSPSKCNCNAGFTIDIFVETATLEVTKTPVPTTVSEDGGTVTYTVSVKNLAAQASVTLDTLCDDKYGDLTGNLDPACGAGPFESFTNSTCTLATIPAGNVPGNPYTCTFDGAVPPGDTGSKFTDTVKACGTDSFGHSNRCDEGSADVTYTDVVNRPTLTKTAKSAACTVDVTYEVAVTNNSAIDVLTLNSLSDDKFGSITAAHAAGGGFEEVVSTDCSVSQTLQPGADPSNPYKCTFVGRISFADCSFGTHTDTVTGSATDDDGVTTDGTTTPALKDDATVTVTVGGL